MRESSLNEWVIDQPVYTPEVVDVAGNLLKMLLSIFISILKETRIIKIKNQISV